LFAELMRQGVAFPPIQIVVSAADVFRVTNGSHRVAASLLFGFTHVPTATYN
jgi:hypothetical protein